jgi:hypothetical protein
MERLGTYKFKVFHDEKWDGWSYKIYDQNEKELMESKEIFNRKGIARYAVIGHITLFESKESFNLLSERF